MKLGTLFVSAVIGLGMVAGVRAQQIYDYVGSPGGAWTAYASSTLPTLNTAPPARIDNPSSGFKYARSTAAAGSFPGVWKAGDQYSMLFSGTLSNGTLLRMEFTDSTHTRGLQLYLENGSLTGNDKIAVQSLGTVSGNVLFQNGDFGGVAGSAQPITVNLTLKVLPGATTAGLYGSVSDSTGPLWFISSGAAVPIPLGATATPLYAGFNISSIGHVTGISLMEWKYVAIPEPQTVTLLTLMGVAALGWLRRGSR